MEYISELLGILGGGTVILYALTSFVSSIWKGRIDSKDKANHSIAQQAYAKFFSSKMDAYIKLANLKKSYFHAIDNFVPTPEDGELDINIDKIFYMDKIRNHILENHIYLSDALNESFENWNEKFTKLKVTNTMNIRERWDYFQSLEEGTGISANALADEETQIEYNKFLISELKLWSQIFKTLDKDIIKLRKRYDL